MMGVLTLPTQSRIEGQPVPGVELVAYPDAVSRGEKLEFHLS